MGEEEQTNIVAPTYVNLLDWKMSDKMRPRH